MYFKFLNFSALVFSLNNSDKEMIIKFANNIEFFQGNKNLNNKQKIKIFEKVKLLINDNNFPNMKKIFIENLSISMKNKIGSNPINFINQQIEFCLNNENKSTHNEDNFNDDLEKIKSISKNINIFKYKKIDDQDSKISNSEKIKILEKVRSIFEMLSENNNKNSFKKLKDEFKTNLTNSIKEENNTLDKKRDLIKNKYFKTIDDKNGEDRQKSIKGANNQEIIQNSNRVMNLMKLLNEERTENLEIKRNLEKSDFNPIIFLNNQIKNINLNLLSSKNNNHSR
jgi:hypothetical protein